MLDIPLLQELKAECIREGKRLGALQVHREYTLKFLKARFGPAALELAPLLKEIDDERVDEMIDLAATCRSLASFRKKLSPKSR